MGQRQVTYENWGDGFYRFGLVSGGMKCEFLLRAEKNNFLLVGAVLDPMV